MKESQIFQDGRTLEPLEVIVVRDRSVQERPTLPVLNDHSSKSLSSGTFLTMGSAAALGLVGLVFCSAAFLTVGHLFGVLAQNWEGSFAPVPLAMERGWSGHLRQAWALADGPVASERDSFHVGLHTVRSRFYLRPFVAQTEAALTPVSLREAFLSWQALERVPASLTTQEQQVATGVEYSEERIVLTQVRARQPEVERFKSRRQFPTKIVGEAARASKPPLAFIGELSGPPLATLAEKFAATQPEVPEGFSWDLLGTLQAHPAKSVSSQAQATQVTQVTAPPAPTTSKVQELEQSNAVALCEVTSRTERAPKLTREMWSREGAGRSWSRVSGSGAWSTAYYGIPGACAPALTDEELSRISQNSGRVLHRQMGILFGRVAAGWDVEVAGRPSQDLFWGPVETDGMRKFYWTNVPPGFATLRFYQHARPIDSGALALPVQSGVATHVDLSQINKVTVAGRVLSGSKKKRDPLVSAEVVAIHHRSASVVTDRDGVFVFEPLWLPNGYPVDIDVQAVGNWPHRYSVSSGSESIQDLSLYVMDSAQVRRWLSAFNGDLSTESAIVFGAFSAEARQRVGADVLLPQIEPWERVTPHLMPESYSLSRAGDLRPGRPIETGADRFLLVQVPGGPSKIVFSDAREKEVFSELRFQSPGVITIVGPF